MAPGIRSMFACSLVPTLPADDLPCQTPPTAQGLPRAR